MSDVSISYKGAEIASLDASGTKRLLTSGKYCEDDIEVAYTKPSGGGLPSPYKFVTGVLTPTSDSKQLTFPLPEFTEIPWYFICWVENYTSYAYLKRVIVKAESVLLRSVKEPNANPSDVKAVQEINAYGNAENQTSGTTATYSSSGITIKTDKATYFRATVPYSYVAFGV